MIISYKYKYLFVEIPHTASTAISYELRENYGGEEILHKHATLFEFNKNFGKDARNFFVIGGLRNPLDITVTRYFKRKTNHQNFYSTPKNWQKFGGHVTNKAIREYQYITKHNADFGVYFSHFYWFPYDTWGSPEPKDFDFIIHYEKIQDDFSRLLSVLNLTLVRPIPIINKTDLRDRDFSVYYPPSIMPRASWVFGPFMKLWNYSFPWGSPKKQIQALSQILFQLLRPIRKLNARNRFG